MAKAIHDNALTTPSPGAGWCAMWVSQVYYNAGFGYIGGNADDMYYRYCHSSDRSELKVGMLIAVDKYVTNGYPYAGYSPTDVNSPTMLVFTWATAWSEIISVPLRIPR